MLTENEENLLPQDETMAEGFMSAPLVDLEDEEYMEEAPVSLADTLKEVEEEEEYDRKVEEGEWGSQDLVNIGAGISGGVARSLTGTLSLAADMADAAAEMAGFEGFENQTLQDIHSKLDLSDNIADYMGADQDSEAFKNARAISEGVAIGLQVLVGVGAFRGGASLGKAVLRQGNPIKGVIKAGKEGAKAVTSGSKKAAAAKGAAVIGAEEMISQENANEGGFIVDKFLRDSEEDIQAVEEINIEVMNILQKTDPDLMDVAAEYITSNPKRESSSMKRLQNRLEGVVDGLTAGAVVGVSANVLMKYFKGVKQSKYNASVAKDVRADQVIVDRKIANAKLRGEEVTDEMIAGFKEEAKAARKAETNLNADEIRERADKEIFGEKGLFKQVEEGQIAESAQFLDDENILGVFERAKQGLDLSEDDVASFRKLARSNNRIAKLTGKKKEFFAKASTREINDIMKDQKFLSKTQKAFVADREVLTQAREKITSHLGKVNAAAAKMLKETGEISPEIVLMERALVESDALLRSKTSAMDSLSGQFLRMAKDDAKKTIPHLDRYINAHKSSQKWKSSDPEFLEFKSRVYLDDEFRAKFLENADASALKGSFMSFLSQKADAFHDLYRQHLLTSVKGVVRNTGEGTVLSAARFSRDLIADQIGKLTGNRVLSTKKVLSETFTRDNTNIAFARFKAAFKDPNNSHAKSKLGEAAIVEAADTDGTIKTLLKQATSLGRKSVVAGDKLISTYNEAYYINKQIETTLSSIFQDNGEALISLGKKISNNEGNLTKAEYDLFNEVSQRGVNPVDFAKNIELQGLEGATEYVVSSLRKSPEMIVEAKKYADKIAMNADIEELGLVAQSFSKIVLPMSENTFTRMFMPFPRPALSALDEAIEWTPLLNLPRLTKRLKSGSVRERHEAVAQLGMSITGLGAGWGLYTSGLITGNGPKEPNANKAWRAAGNKPNTLTVAGKPYAIEGTIIGSIAQVINEAYDAFELTNDNSLEYEEKMKLVSAGMVSAAMELPQGFWTDSLDPLIKLMKADQLGSKSAEAAQAAIITNLIKGTPAVGLAYQVSSQVKSGIPQAVSDTSTKTGAEPFQRAWNDVKKNLLGFEVPKRVSFITGEDLDSGKSWKAPLLSMKSFKESKHKDVEEYINALVQSAGAKNSRSTRDYLRFTEPKRTITTDVDKVSYKLSAEEYEILSRLSAQPTGWPPMTDAIREVMEQLPVESLSTQREKDYATAAVNQIMNEYKKAAREEFKENSEEYQAFARNERINQQDREEETASLNF